MLAIHVLSLSLALHLRTSSGFSFTINNTPQQCSDLNISVVGSGQPPYSAVIVPYGSTPLPNNIEVRNVVDVPFSGVSTSTSFKLPYPDNSQFVVMVSKPISSAVEKLTLTNYHRSVIVQDLGLEGRALQCKSKLAAAIPVATVLQRPLFPSPSVPLQTTSSSSVHRHEYFGILERRWGKCHIMVRMWYEYTNSLLDHLEAFNFMA